MATHGILRRYVKVAVIAGAVVVLSWFLFSELAGRTDSIATPTERIETLIDLYGKSPDTLAEKIHDEIADDDVAVAIGHAESLGFVTSDCAPAPAQCLVPTLFRNINRYRIVVIVVPDRIKGTVTVNVEMATS